MSFDQHLDLHNPYPGIDLAASMAIDRAVAVLNEGGLVAVPTETVYGLAADADNRSAVLKTFEAKGRPTNHPLIVHVTGLDTASCWVKRLTEAAIDLADAFWPGPLTMVLPRSSRCRDFVTGGQDTVAVRAPAHPWIRDLLLRFEGSDGHALTAPSANSFGRISPTCAKHVADDLGVKPAGKVDMILDGGVCEVGLESTIVNLAGPRPEILRHGAITRAMLEDVLGCPVPDAGSDAPRVPGTLKSHYAPRTATEIVEGGTAGLERRIGELGHERLAVLAPDALELEAPNVVLAIDAPLEPAAFAHVLYMALHRLDRAGATRILIARPGTGPAWAAVNDRLGRAAAERKA